MGFNELLKSNTAFIKQRVDRAVRGIEYSTKAGLRAEKEKDRQALFDLLQKGLQIAQIAKGSYDDNKAVERYAKEYGYEPKGSIFTRVFGKPSFKDPLGDEASFEDMLFFKTLSDFERDRFKTMQGNTLNRPILDLLRIDDVFDKTNETNKVRGA
jgi:hypothetical protein